MKKINKRDLIKKLVIEPKTQKRIFWPREMKLLNDLMGIFEDQDFWNKIRNKKVPSLAVLKSAAGLKILKRKYREFCYKIPEKVTIKLGEKLGEDKEIIRKPKTIRQFIDE